MTRNSSNVSVVGNVLIPAKIMRLLQKGPKFGVEASLSAPNVIAMNRKVADEAQDDNRDCCLLEGVECLGKFAPKSKDFHCSRIFDDVVSFFKSNNLMLTQADKDGGFAVLPKGTYNEKALAPVNKSFAPVKKSEVRIKCKAINLFLVHLEIKTRDLKTTAGNLVQENGRG
ncbi:hypothetical protein HPB50_026730 [Hyalomma asiaticum]|uniref:Uncharacterized protein n=1 Tax=Hyalomma asiaticum TaxID=266040 RepID=A0ACB7SR31_HYAAI|nr:hypothetical protein HPB50_026730 [Hyalomma asiaticum]